MSTDPRSACAAAQADICINGTWPNVLIVLGFFALVAFIAWLFLR